MGCSFPPVLPQFLCFLCTWPCCPPLYCDHILSSQVSSLLLPLPLFCHPSWTSCTNTYYRTFSLWPSSLAGQSTRFSSGKDLWWTSSFGREDSPASIKSILHWITLFLRCQSLCI